ncbi:hypothetical protein IV203_027341 [Nitzschia inconspicua]|uniref:Uncharacterized protein n=1 Tax=Nitzschia inconspicua TaxID=303405 RepID=A0A9K3Q424_9STRA|nr:hypothetical protein IV203_027341 [Nitzschia inconspicua]
MAKPSSYHSPTTHLHHNKQLGMTSVLFLIVSALYFLDALTKSMTMVHTATTTTSNSDCMVNLDENHILFNVPQRTDPHKSSSSAAAAAAPTSRTNIPSNMTGTTTTTITSTSSTSFSTSPHHHETSRRGLYNSPVRFIFFIGLEGTGHHLLKGIVSQSPAVDRLRQLHVHYELTTQLQEALHHEKRKNGLFNVHCQPDQDKINTTEIQGRVVDVLRQIHQRVLTTKQDGTLLTHNDDGVIIQQQQQRPQQPRRTDDRGFTHPSRLTALPINTLQASTSSGEMSYPNYHGDCRKLNFPNMDLWYHACRAAQVDCQHVYIFRDPYAILKSTTVHRDHNGKHKLAAIHLYTSLQTVILAQLMTWPDRTLGCMGMLDGNNHYNHSHNTDDDDDDDEPVPVVDWWETIRIIFGWKNRTSFDHHVKKKFFKPRHAMTPQQRHELVPPTLQPYMDSWMRIHDKTIRLCHKQARQNQDLLMAF